MGVFIGEKLFEQTCCFTLRDTQTRVRIIDMVSITNSTGHGDYQVVYIRGKSNKKHNLPLSEFRQRVA